MTETFKSMNQDYRITINPGPSDGKSHPVIFLIHGNFGLGDPYGTQIHSFAQDIAKLGYVTAVPQYYLDDEPHVGDFTPHTQTLADAVAAVAKRSDVDIDRLGIIGFSLGATTAMTYITEKPPGQVKVFADFFGLLTPQIEARLDYFPPTIIFHNRHDVVVPVQNSLTLDRLLPSTVDHELVPPYDEYWQMAGNHAFRPGGAADTDSRARTTKWLTLHLPTGGR